MCCLAATEHVCISELTAPSTGLHIAPREARAPDLEANSLNQLSYGSVAGMDKVTTHRMDGQPSFSEWEHIFRIAGRD